MTLQITFAQLVPLSLAFEILLIFPVQQYIGLGRIKVMKLALEIELLIKAEYTAFNERHSSSEANLIPV